LGIGTIVSPCPPSTRVFISFAGTLSSFERKYLNDEKKLLPCAVHLNGEYGINNIYAGVPVIIGKDGVEKIEEIDLDEKEKKEFMNSIDAVKKLWKAASVIDTDLSK